MAPPVVCQLLSGIRSNFNDPKLSDVTLLSEGHSIHVHKLVLCSRSPYFKQLLAGDFAESGQKEVPLGGIPHRALLTVLEDLYFLRDSAEVLISADDPEFLNEVIAVADRLMLEDVVDKCMGLKLDAEAKAARADAEKPREAGPPSDVSQESTASRVSDNDGQSDGSVEAPSVEADPAEALTAAQFAEEPCACRRTTNPRDPKEQLPEDAIAFPEAPGLFAFGRCPRCIAATALATTGVGASDDLALVIVSRNYESYLCGHSVYAWHFCNYLLANTGCTVYHIMHHPDDGPRHGKQICPPIEHERYNMRLIGDFSHGKLPSSFKSCLTADVVSSCISEARARRPDRPVATVLISPFMMAADVLAVCKEHRAPCYSSMRGTDLLLLKKKDFRESVYGVRYEKALREMDGMYVQGEWMQGEAIKLGIPTAGLFQTVNDLPAGTDLGSFYLNWSRAVGFDPRDRRPLICYVGRLSPEKGAIAIARTFRYLLASREDVRVLVAGSGPSEPEVRDLVPEIPGRSVITKLSIFEVFAVAKHCGGLPGSLLVTAPGLEGDFQEALGSTYIYFSTAGTPVLFPVDNNTGGLLETVSPQNTEWCREVGLPVEGWPTVISKYLDGEYSDRQLGESNTSYGRRWLGELQIAPRLSEWAAAARAAAGKK
jgi:glycosyltransferase involved in cell wall biosynthesis